MGEFDKEFELWNSKRSASCKVHRVKEFLKGSMLDHSSAKGFHNIIGRVSVIKTPLKTRGNDYLIALFLEDPTEADGSFLMNVNLFHPTVSAIIDENTRVGDILLLESIKLQQYQNFWQGVSVKKKTQVRNLSLARRSKHKLSVPESLLKAAEEAKEGAKPPEIVPPLEAPIRINKKQKLVKDIASDNIFIDLVGQVLSISPCVLANKVQLVVCDFTENAKLAPSLFQENAIVSNCRRKSSMELVLYLWDEFAVRALETCKVDDIYFFANVRIKACLYGNDSLYAGNMHGVRPGAPHLTELQHLMHAPAADASATLVKKAALCTNQQVLQLIKRRLEFCPEISTGYQTNTDYPHVPITPISQISSTAYPRKYRCAAKVSSLVPESPSLGLEALCLHCEMHFSVSPESLRLFSTTLQCPLCTQVVTKITQIRVLFGVVLEELNSSITAFVDTQQCFRLFPAVESVFNRLVASSGQCIVDELKQLADELVTHKSKLNGLVLNVCILSFKSSSGKVIYKLFGTFG